MGTTAGWEQEQRDKDDKSTAEKARLLDKIAKLQQTCTGMPEKLKQQTKKMKMCPRYRLAIASIKPFNAEI